MYGNGLSKPVNGTRYEYNAQLQVSKEISPEGYVKEYEYDKFNNITQVRNYGTGSIPAISIAEYDLLGRKQQNIHQILQIKARVQQVHIIQAAQLKL